MGLRTHSSPFHMVDMMPWYNNDGISANEDRSDGDFSGTGATYASDLLPPSNSLVECDGILFLFPDKSNGKKNNMSLVGQTVPVEEDFYECLHILGVSASNSLADQIRFHYSDGTVSDARLALSSWRSVENLQYGEKVAVHCLGFHFQSRRVDTTLTGAHCGIWMQSIRTPHCLPLKAIQFADLPELRIFAITLTRNDMDQP